MLTKVIANMIKLSTTNRSNRWLDKRRVSSEYRMFVMEMKRMMNEVK